MESEPMKNPDSPAFPTLVSGRTQNGEICHNDIGGLTRRDYFAAKAAQGFISNSQNYAIDCTNFSKQIAQFSVRVADVLIAELDQK